MKLKVPFCKQTTEMDCGPTALKMVLSYFGDNKDISFIIKKCKMKPGKGVYTIQLATAASDMGYKTKFFSRYLGINPENSTMEFYKKCSDDSINSEDVLSEARSVGVEAYEEIIHLEDILKFVSKKSIPIILLDWNVVTGNEEKGYQGHFVPVVGYDNENVYVHNQGLDNPKEFLKIKQSVFEEARKSKGTDEDIAIIFNTPKDSE